MNELWKYRRVLTRTTLYFLALCFLGAAVFPQYRSIALGMVLGSSVSLLNSFYLGYKVQKVLDTVASGEGKKVNMGFMTRAAVSVLAIVVAYQKPETFNLYAVAATLILSQFLLLFIGIRLSRKQE
ncbi:ATP synthase subunit I [Paenibacillus sp. SAF-054]|uniref:ATP synthase subunit I n=1 Tax=unclassified Paenibacillus TaxID=185978 RepID=UPI003F81FFDD